MTERVLNERYQIEALIGRGGMADVYRGKDLSLEREVAVKMLRPDLARDPMFQTRFKREAQSSAGLNHPNIVGVYDTGSAEVPGNGAEIKTPFIVMEYVDGVTLRHILHGTPSGQDEDAPPPPPEPGESTGGEARTDSDVLGVADPDDTQVVPHVTEPLQEKIDSALERPLTETEAAGYMSGVLAALSYSHSRGIVHRDIKPSNVMVSNAGDVKVMDFGIARALADSAQTMTQTSAVVGTAQYLSPEQARGEVVDHRSDLYSAGCVLFELLTNRPPFTGDSPVSVAYQHVREQPPAVSDYNNRISPAMESVVAKALTKDPALRFQSADEFDDALADALRGIPVDEAATTELAAVGAMSAGTAGFDNLVSRQPAMSARTPEDPDYDDYQEYGAAGAPRRNRAGLYVLLVLLALVLVAGLTFLLAQLLDGGPDDDQVADNGLIAVPDVAGWSQPEAHAELTNAGFTVQVETEPDNEVEANHATRTDPEAGEEAQSGSEVTLYISEGPSDVQIPDGLAGQPEETVRSILEDAGLQVGEVTEEDHEEYAEGEVISTSPESGTSVTTGETVDLVISTGERELPSGLIGIWQQEAGQALAAEDFEWEVHWVTVEDPEDEGISFAGEVVEITVESPTGDSVNDGGTVPNDAVIYLHAVSQQSWPDEDEDDDEDEEDEDEEDEDSDNGDEDEDEEDPGNEDGNGNGNDEDEE
ncbi:protein kinase domain-containing protein [Nesterenkonia ebinurensis]|uniref:protein kinase domain-containing protein n=1 Tax=Nesterenkonia ebinurensis TaxID=2608252 RepID=UPI00123CADCB|nr:protein kinase [Nesterenkonia ebinurensis]